MSLPILTSAALVLRKVSTAIRALDDTVYSLQQRAAARALILLENQFDRRCAAADYDLVGNRHQWSANEQALDAHHQQIEDDINAQVEADAAEYYAKRAALRSVK